MKKWIIKNLLLLIFATGATLLTVSIIFYPSENSAGWKFELAKALISLSITVIIGGLIKLVFDVYNRNTEKERRSYEKEKEFKTDVLNRLRKVFDAVDSSRLLIEAHKSARTYGEQMRGNVIPSVTSLFDIKRSLVDSKDIIGEEKLPYLRVSLHYMLAYLKVLTEEYKQNYLDISNKQYFQEAIKDTIKKSFITQLEKENPTTFSSLVGLQSAQLLLKNKENDIPEPPDFTWNNMKEQKYLKDYLSDSYNALYYTIFIDSYEYCKKIFKDTITFDEIVNFKKIDEKYLNILKETDEKKASGNIKKGGSLVEKIMKDKLGYLEFYMINLNGQVGEAEQKQDIEFFKEMLDDELEFQRTDGTVINKEKFINQLSKRMYYTMYTEVLKVNINEEFGFADVIANVTTSGDNEGKSFKGVFENSRHWKRDELGEWKLKKWFNKEVA